MADLATLWKQLGNTGDLPAGWFGPGGSPTAPVTDPYQAQINIQKADTAKILGEQKAEEEALFKEFETKQAGQEKLPALYARLGEELNLPSLSQQLELARGEVFEVKDLIDRLEEDINARTTGTFTSEPMRRRQLAAEEAPLRTQLGRLLGGQEIAAGQIATATTALGTRFGLEVQQQEKELDPTKLRLSAFSERAARELNAYTQANENELNLLLQKLQGEQELSIAELNRASALAQIEAKAQADFEQIRRQMEADIEKDMRTGGTPGTPGTPIPPSTKPATKPTGGTTWNDYQSTYNQILSGGGAATNIYPSGNVLYSGLKYQY